MGVDARLCVPTKSSHTFYVGDGQWLVHNASCDLTYDWARNRGLYANTGYQLNHLNQAAAFPKIPYGDGVIIPLKGMASAGNDEHYLFHQALEEFWNLYRGTTTRPTVAQYNTALQGALERAGLSSDEVSTAVAAAQKQQQAYGYAANTRIVNIPSPVKQR